MDEGERDAVCRLVRVVVAALRLGKRSWNESIVLLGLRRRRRHRSR